MTNKKELASHAKKQVQVPYFLFSMKEVELMFNLFREYYQVLEGDLKIEDVEHNNVSEGTGGLEIVMALLETKINLSI